jgi:triosephosphate isomerase
MHPASRHGARELATEVAALTRGLRTEVVVCPPAVWLVDVADALAAGEVGIGAQTMHPAASGAFTGEISPVMLDGLAAYVIVGHSERRRMGETDAEVGEKVASAVAHGLRPIAAIGESAQERRDGRTEGVIERQLAAALAHLDRLAGSGLVIAYEPIWAIGTGDPASAADAQAAAALVRDRLRATDPRGADETRILYGGSVQADNASAFFAEPDVDGALVGGASLDAATFAAIARAAA